MSLSSSDARPAAPFPTSPPEGGSPRPWSFPALSRRILENGLELCAVRIPTLPMVQVRWTFRGGRLQERPSPPGTARLLGQLARYGTPRWTAHELADHLDFLGVRLRCSVTTDSLSNTVTALSHQLEEALDVLDEVTLRPTIPEGELQRERAKALELHRHDLSEPDHLVNLWLSHLVFGDHAYGRPSATAAGLAAVGREDILGLLGRVLRPDQGMLLVVGDIDPDAVIERLTLRHAGMARPATPLPVPGAWPAAGRRVLVVDRPGSEQVSIGFGKTSISRLHPDYLALRLANQVLGGGASSRLFLELRERRSLTYGVYSSFEPGLYGGEFTASLSTAPQKAALAVSSLMGELERFVAEPIPAAEIEEARRTLIGSFPQRATGVSGVGGLVAGAWLHGLPATVWSTYLTEMDAEPVESVQAAARAWLRPDDGCLVLVGPGELCREAAAPYGAVEERTAEELGFEG